MSAGDECDVIAFVGAGEPLAEAARRAWDEGRAILPINPAFTTDEITTLLERLRPTHGVAGTGGGPHDSPAVFPGGVPAPAGTAAVVVTSGTEGTPKGVELTRAGMEAMGRGYSAGLDAGPGDRWLACLPLHHVASLGALARSYVTGVPCTVHARFDVERVAQSARAEGTTIVSLVPTTIRRLLDAGAPLHDFRWVIAGGAPCPPALRARAEDAGVHVIDAYGLSETWGGFALDGTPIDGAAVHTAVDGEILVRGLMVMRGYRLDPIRSQAAFDSDGWFRTGDIGAIDDDGRVHVTDRVKDVVITGGVNVSPTEVETVLAQHPRVHDVSVVGVPDDEWGELVVAFVVPHPESPAPTLAELRDFARERLSGPKLPRAAHTIAEIPRTTSGKPLRRLLRERATGDGAGT